ncbi:MAG: hypothetical protein H2045_12880 [Rhizobiales bacterium]|nr:hypothetical protein [Hyphomicrobiales bacterium]
MRRPVRTVTSDLSRAIARMQRRLMASVARARHRRAEEIAAAISASAPDVRVNIAESGGRSLLDITGNNLAARAITGSAEGLPDRQAGRPANGPIDR